MPTSLFLPDFVGYPFCYLGLRAALPETLPAIHVDYNDHWPYPSVAALADAIVGSLGPVDVHVVVGYSFGAHVAIDVANTLARQGRAVEVVLIDPPQVTEVSSLGTAEIEAILRQRPEYQYLFELVDCELASLECMVANIQALSRLPERRRIEVSGTMLVAGSARKAEEVRRGFDCPAGDLEAICLEECDHRSIVAHPALHELLVRKIRLSDSQSRPRLPLATTRPA